MPFALGAFGIVLLVTGVRNTQGELFTLLKGDFSGDKNFIYWVISLLVIGSLGYIDRLKGVSHALLALVLVVLFLSDKGFFEKFQEQIGPKAAVAKL